MIVPRSSHGCFRFGDGWEFGCNTLRLKHPAGDEVELSMKERALLRVFLDAPQRTMSREHPLEATRTYGITGTRSVDMQILRLRRKLPGIVQTRRGEGYAFAVLSRVSNQGRTPAHPERGAAAVCQTARPVRQRGGD
jgi:DNA-binding response OmpR family regulator